MTSCSSEVERCIWH